MPKDEMLRRFKLGYKIHLWENNLFIDGKECPLILIVQKLAQQLRTFIACDGDKRFNKLYQGACMQMNLSTYLDGHKNIWKGLPVSVMEMDSKLLCWHNSHYSQKHRNYSSWSQQNEQKTI